MWRCLRQSHSLWRQRPLVPQTATRCLSSEAGKGVPYESQLKDVKGAGSQAVPQSADAVIIGGGAIGCSILYHLTKLGMKNVVLLEKDQLTAGTTWHTAGLLWNLRPNDIDIQLIRHSRNLMKSLEEETGVHSGWVENGGLWVASNETRLNEFKRMQSLGKFFGIPSYHLSQAETKELYPLLDVSDVIGSIYSPEDGTIDPAGYCTGLSRAARSRGGQVITGCSVTDIKTGVDDFGTKRVKAVETNFGTIQTDNVVNACGVWAPHIGAMAGVNVPLVAMRHAYVVTEKIEGIQNMPNLRDHDASVYLKLQGDALCVGGYEPNPIFIDKMDSEFAFSLYELDWDVFLYNMEGIMKCVPAIAESGVKSTVCGPESFTADHKPLAGESPEVRGFHLCCGFNSGGMMFSGGFGWQMAEWIINGKPTLDMYSYDIRRFTTKLTDNPRWIKERSHESYAKNYSIVFPHDEPLAGRNMRKDALHQVLEDAGCVYQERQGWERPGWFSTSTTAHIRDYDYYGYYDYPANTNYTYNDKLQLDYTFDFPENHFMIENEALTCRQRVALFNMSYFTKLFLSGPDAQKAVDWIFSNDMRKPNGSTVYTCMLNKRAGIEGDLTVSVVEPSETGQVVPSVDGRCFYIAVGGAMGQYAISHLNDIIQDNKFDVHLDDKSDDMCLLSVQGPKSRDVLQPLCNSDLSDEAFPFSTNKLVTIAGHEVLAMRVSFVGELGWELHVPSSTAVDVYHAVMAAGAEKGICNAGYRAIDALSIEKGYRHWHGDVRPDDSPLESGLMFTCKLKTDVPFLGREALEERRKCGAKKKLACFTIDEHVALQSLEAIYRDGLPVGYLRRADYAFALGKSIGYGYVHHPQGETVNNAFLKAGEYHIERMGVKYPATLHLKTPFDPKNERVKGIYTAHVDPMVSQAQN